MQIPILPVLIAAFFIAFPIAYWFGVIPKHRRVKITTNFFRRSYYIGRSFFLTRFSVLKIKSKIGALSIYRRSEVEIEAMKVFFKVHFLFVMLSLFSVWVFKDFISLLLALFFAFVVKENMIDRVIHKLQQRILEEVSVAIGSVQEEYLRTNSVVTSIAAAEVGELVRTPFEKISDFLTSSNNKELLEEFYNTTPFRPLQTFATISYDISFNGDTRHIDGPSNYIRALTFLLQDIYFEIEKMDLERKSFGGAIWMPIAALIMLPMMMTSFSFFLPSLGAIYNSSLGYLVKSGTIALILLSFLTISKIVNSTDSQVDDRSYFIESMLSNPGIRDFVKGISPKNAKRLKVKKFLKSSLSRMTVEHFYLRKIVNSIAAGVLALLMVVSSVQIGKEFAENSVMTVSLSSTPGLIELADEQVLLQMDREYVEMFNERYETRAIALEEKLASGNMSKEAYDKAMRASVISVEEAGVLVEKYLPTATDFDIMQQIDRMEAKARTLKESYFKWYYLFVIMGIALLGFWFPDIQCRTKAKIIKIEAREDFLQLQTLTSVLMLTSINVIELVGRLADHSRIHKDELLYCYYSMTANPVLELTRLQTKTPLNEFKRFIGNIKTAVSDLELSNAFSRLTEERTHIANLRKTELDFSVKQKKNTIDMVTNFAFQVAIFGSMILPIGLLAYAEAVRVMGQFNL